MKKRLLAIALALTLMCSGIVPMAFIDNSYTVNASASAPEAPVQVPRDGSADSVIEFARQFTDLQGLNSVKDRMKACGYSCWKPTFYSEWCSWFVSNCGRLTGSASRIGCGIMVNTLSYQTVNKKGAKIHFVNKRFYKNKKKHFKSSRRSYSKSYKPRKGDLIIFSSDGSYWWTHVGIVTENCSNAFKSVPTIEGNTSSDFFWKSVVAEKSRTSRRGFRIVAYITPKYKKRPAPAPEPEPEVKPEDEAKLEAAAEQTPATDTSQPPDGVPGEPGKPDGLLPEDQAEADKLNKSDREPAAPEGSGPVTGIT